MGLNHTYVLGLKITVDSEQQILEYIEKYLLKARNPESGIRKISINPLVIFTPNPEIIVHAQKDIIFKKIVNSAQINIPDGAGTVWALEKLYKIKINRLTGIDLMEKLCRLAEGKRFRVGVIGGRAGVAVKALECLKNTYAKLIIEVLGEPEIKLVSGIEYIVSGLKKEKNRNIQNTKYLILNTSGEQLLKTDKYFENLAGEIINKKLDIIFVGLGFPKQEYFIHILNSYFLIHNSSRRLIMMSVGGAFDYISGKIPRAPKWMRDRGWEWLYRLIREPWRMKRQILGAQFFFKILQNN